MRVPRSAVALGIVRGVVWHGSPGHPTFQLPPRDRRIIPAHFFGLSARASRSEPAYFVGARGRRACPLTSPQHGARYRRSQMRLTVDSHTGLPSTTGRSRRPATRTAVDAGDLKPRNLAPGLVPQLVNGPGTCPRIDWHQLGLIADADKRGAAVISPRLVTLTGLRSSLSTTDGRGWGRLGPGQAVGWSLATAALDCAVLAVARPMG